MQTQLKPPIILIGNHRSGTTIVQKLFALHPQVVTWYEPRTLWRCADPARSHDEYDDSDAPAKLVSYIRERFRRYQASNGDRRVMEKTPSNVLRVPYLWKVFPDATYLFITRNPFSYISSMQLKWPKTKSWAGLKRTIAATPPSQLPYYANEFLQHFVTRKILKNANGQIFGPRYRGIQRDLEECSHLTVMARQWAVGNRKAREDLQRLGNGSVLTFRYEDLVADPEGIVQRIYRHCHLDCSDEILQTVRKMVDPGRQEKWLRLDRDELKKVIPELEPEMRHYGYEVPAQLA